MGTQQFSEVTTMRSEAERLSTFHSWPHNDKVEARKIAKAGFFHTGNNDSEVKCFWCNTVLTDWQYGDQVMARHRSANPDCPFIKNVSDNVPLLNSETSVISQTSENEMEGKSKKIVKMTKVRFFCYCFDAKSRLSFKKRPLGSALLLLF